MESAPCSVFFGMGRWVGPVCFGFKSASGFQVDWQMMRCLLVFVTNVMVFCPFVASVRVFKSPLDHQLPQDL